MDSIRAAGLPGEESVNELFRQLYELNYFEHARKKIKEELVNAMSYSADGVEDKDYKAMTQRLLPVILWLSAVESDAMALAEEATSQENRK